VYRSSRDTLISPQVIPIQFKAPLVPTQVKSLHHFEKQEAQVQSTSTLNY
jgi:hypothetical protein